MGDHNHHAEQQGQRVEVDGLVGFIKRERAGTDH
jgi:hypothetical protein